MESTVLSGIKDTLKEKEVSTERVIRVSATTNSKELGKSIFAVHTKENLDECVVRAIGAGAISQAMKAIIISGTYLASKGMKPAVYPSFKDLGEENVTAMELKVVFQKS